MIRHTKHEGSVANTDRPEWQSSYPIQKVAAVDNSDRGLCAFVTQIASLTGSESLQTTVHTAAQTLAVYSSQKELYRVRESQ